jgi:hypothetical protein
MKDFPNDADGDALRRIAAHSDMSKPMVIDFTVVVPSESAGLEVGRLAALRGYRSTVEKDAENDEWTCCCTRSMLATYRNVVSAQQELDEISASLGGRSDGWGTLGNGGLKPAE